MSNAQKSEEPLLIKGFETSALFLGDHQFYKGYAVLVAKRCVRDVLDLDEQEGMQLWRELMISAQAIQDAYRPWKLNYASLGNQCPHLHWHIFPRYETDPLRRENPWAQQSEFARHASHNGDYSSAITQIRQHL